MNVWIPAMGLAVALTGGAFDAKNGVVSYSAAVEPYRVVESSAEAAEVETCLNRMFAEGFDHEFSIPMDGARRLLLVFRITKAGAETPFPIIGIPGPDGTQRMFVPVSLVSTVTYGSAAEPHRVESSEASAAKAQALLNRLHREGYVYRSAVLLGGSDSERLLLFFRAPDAGVEQWIRVAEFDPAFPPPAERRIGKRTR